MQTMHMQIIKSLMRIFFPPRCPICDGVLFHSLFVAGEMACRACRDKPEYITGPACMKCGKPLADERQEYCFDCARGKAEYDQGKALWVYRAKVKDSIYRFKYQNRREYAAYYGAELVRIYGDWIRMRKVQAIVPIPISKARYRRRGYNQAELVAKEVGKRMGLPVYGNLLLRIRDTGAQKELSVGERKNNLKKAFKMKENKVQLDHILLIDDIYTTGSTMNEAARELRRAGVGHVYCLSVSIGKGH